VEETYNPPKIFTGMNELYNVLKENGIEVYVMSAANEELVRMVASVSKYGYYVKPENVFGVNMLLKDRKTGQLTTSRRQIKDVTYDRNANLSLELTPYLVNHMNWFEGKYGSIVGWINQWRGPISVGGDTPLSDGYMLLNGVDVKSGGVHIWVNKRDDNMADMKRMWEAAAAKQKELRLPVTADKNWVIVKPEEIQ
jgi:hypothetical protein